MKKVAILLAAALLLGATRFILNRQPDAVIVIEALSPQEVDVCGDPARLDECPLPEGITLPEGATPSNGLHVVGNGELVYLSAGEASGEEVTAYAWSISSTPSGSGAVLSSTDAAWTTFRPDVLGQYTVDVMVTTVSGMAGTSVTLTSAEYVGVGSMGGLTPDAGEGQCAACHPGNTDSYFGTGHAAHFTNGINGDLEPELGSPYNPNCIRCHSVGYNEDPEAVNGGFDDVAAALGWTFPDMLKADNWDELVANFPALAQKSNIQCENCHGAGSEHRGNKANIAFSVDPGVCFRCHDDEPAHSKGTQWKNSRHAVGVASASTRATGDFEAAEGFGCNGCHSGYGFINRVDPTSDLRDESNQPLVTGSPQITCAVCHDPHDATNEHQLRRVDDVELTNGEVITFGGIGKLCMNCHKARENAEEYVAEPHSTFRGPHHNPQADMLAGTNAFTFGRTLPNSTHKDVLPEACISCHMYETPAEGELGHNVLGEHSWNMAFDVVVGTDTVEVQNVAVCRNCHEPDLASFEERMARVDYDEDGEIEGAEDEVEGLMEEVAMLLPPVGEPTVDNQDPIWSDPGSLLQRKAFYNYLFVEEDKSHGFHNFQFTVNLLLLTKDVLTYGVLSEGTIANIADVPNDQGKQVNVAWSRFGGDGPSDNPLQTYYVWRRVDQASKDGTVYKSLGDVPADVEQLDEGASVMFDGAQWTQVASQPAAQMEMYHAIAPTLYDSTASGMHWSVFVVSGHTATSTVFVVSEPDSAYSIDNLVPSAPSGIAATRQDANVQLTWEDPVDADFDYVAIYRSTTQGFDPSLIDPLATTVETQYTDAGAAGTAYFYRLAAFDFSGNRSVFSNEIIPSASTDIAEEPGIPTEYDLYQNYPNPFNPTTTIAFAVPEAATVRITVFNVSGKAVATLVDRSMAPGNYNVTWNAEHLASGVYFYKMEAGTFVKAKSVLLVK